MRVRRVFYNFPWREAAPDVSRRPKIFVKAAIEKPWAKIISGHLKILGRFLGNIYLVGKILDKIKIFVQDFAPDFVPIQTALRAVAYG